MLYHWILEFCAAAYQFFDPIQAEVDKVLHQFFFFSIYS